MRLALSLLVLLLFAGAGVWIGTRTSSSLERATGDLRAEELLSSDLGFLRHPVDAPEGAGATALSDPSSPWTKLNVEAIEALHAGDYERAIECFERAHAGDPDENAFRHNLAEALARKAMSDHERLRPCPSCLEDLGRAVELSPKREDLALLLERWRKEAELERDFWRESSPHFDLAYDGARDEILDGSHRILSELEKAYLDLSELFESRPAEIGEPRVGVVIYRREGFDELTGLGDWAGGAFDGTIRVPVEDFAREERDLTRILRHELVHVFVVEIGGPRVPGWLNEGLAQWLEGSREARVRHARAELRGAELIPLEKLQGSLAQWKDPDAVRRAYAQSLAFVDFLAREHGEHVLYRMVEGQSFEAQMRFGLDLALEDFAADLAGS